MLREQTLYTISPSNDSTLAIEVYRTGLMKRKKHLLFFERFSGELWYIPENPENSRVKMAIDVSSVVCRDKWLKPKSQEEMCRHTRSEVLAADRNPQITFTSSRMTLKPIRGLAAEGALKIGETVRTVTFNVVVNQTKPATLQIDGDATFRLSDFGIARPASHFGLAGTKDEVLVRVLLWGTRRF